MVKQQTRKKKKQYRRKKGGARGETLKFKYTKNPLRVGWTEAIYPLAPLFLQLPAAIPWHTYSFNGTSTVEIEDLGNNTYVNTATLFAKNNNNINENTLKKKYESIFNYKNIPIKATTNTIPYVIFGGSACELYNSLVYKKSSLNIDLHKTTDPTGDMDIQMVPLTVSYENTEQKYKDEDINVLMYNDLKNELSPLYDNYTRWIVEQLKPLLEPLAKQMNSPEFFPKEQAGNAELKTADILIPIGNLLLSRSVIKGMIKIQCGVGVKTSDGPVQDHIFEMVFIINNTEKVNNPAEILSAYKLPLHIGTKSIPLWVQDPITLLNSQAAALVQRIMYREKNEKIHKLYNHYGRMVFCLELLIWAHINQIPPVHYKKIYFPDLNELLESGILESEPSPCFPKCDIEYIKNVYDMILTL